jgi:Protein of unknown function (DUF2891)
MLSSELAQQFAAIALAHVTREYPNKLDHVMAGPADVQAPRALHPVFYGSLDWHSCVHGYWLLARLRRAFPALPQRGQIDALFDAQLTGEKMAVERAYLERPTSGGFERPYGWAWLLMLAEELRVGGAQSASWHQALNELEKACAARFRSYFSKLTYPIRTGTHFNSAFALVLALEYARGYGDAELASLISIRTLDWFGTDAGCQAWEPSGDDFLSPALMEAECIRRVMRRQEFVEWFARFMPGAADEKPAILFTPVMVSDRSDGKIAHLDGLNLSRAWCWRSIAKNFRADDPVRIRALAAAERHLAASLPYMAVDYMGAHWLGSFALLALDAAPPTASARD